MGIIETATDAEITKFVRMLMPSFPKKRISKAKLSKMKQLYQSNQTSACVGEIMEQCGLKGLSVRMCYIWNRPSRAAIKKLVQDNLHHIGSSSTNLCLPASWESTHDFDDTVAFVIRPPDFPLFGTPAFGKTRILLFLYAWRACKTFELFVASIAHELAHVVLDSFRHPLCNNEVAVDLTSMILGFLDIIRNGRWSEDNFPGYLDDVQFELAYEEIRKLSGVIYL